MIPIHYILLFYLLIALSIVINDFSQIKKRTKLYLFTQTITVALAIMAAIWDRYFRETPIMIDKAWLLGMIFFSLIHAVGQIFDKRSFWNWLHLSINLITLIIYPFY